MSIALHIDGRSMCSLRRQGARIIGRQCPAVYITVPPADSEKRLFERARIPYATCDGNTIVFGKPALELAPLLHVPRLPVLPGGRLPEEDPLGRQLAGAIVDSLLPDAMQPAEVCVLTLPAGIETGERSREWQFFSRLVRLRGYAPLCVSASSALALAEFGHAGFTGITLIMDAASTGITLLHQGRVLAEASLPHGGDWIDEHLARKTERMVWDMEGNSYVDIDSLARWKLETAPALQAPQTDEVQLLAYIYEQLFQDSLRAFAAACHQAPIIRTLPPRFSVVCCGEPTLLSGFAQLLGQQIGRRDLPFAVSDIRVVDDPLFAIARGGLIQAELESQPSLLSAAA
jgi:hypothetical protein